MALVSAEVMKYPQYSNEVGSQCLFTGKINIAKNTLDMAYVLFYSLFLIKKKKKKKKKYSEKQRDSVEEKVKNKKKD